MPARLPSRQPVRHRRFASGWMSLWLVLSLLAGPWVQSATAAVAFQDDIPAMAICSTGGAQANPGGSLPLHAGSHCQTCCGSHAPPLPVSSQATPAFSPASYAQAVRPPAPRTPRLVALPAMARAPPA